MDEINPKHSISKADRKTIEKNRRNQMKTLFSELHSLLPPDSRENAVCLSDKVEGATNYIKKLQSTLDSMKCKKESLMRTRMSTLSTKSSSSTSKAGDHGGLKLPRIDIHSNGSSLDVFLITGFNHQYLKFTEIMRVLHQESADVVSANFSVVDDRTVFHTKIGGCGLECEVARLSEKLTKLVVEDNN